MSWSHLPSLFLLAATLTTPLHGVETFRPEPVAWSKAEDVPFVFGDTWVAYREGDTTVTMVDRASGQVVRTFEKPANDTPVEGVSNQWRTVSGWGQILHHGNRLAIVSSAQIRNSPPGSSGTTRNVLSVFLWDLPSGAPAGVLDIDLPSSNPFIGLSATRLVVLDEPQRRFLQWDPVTLAPLPTLTVPAEFPAPASDDNWGGRPVLCGDTVVFRKPGYGEPLDLVAVNMASGGTARLPLPAGRVLQGRIAMGGRNDGLLVTSFSSSGFSTPGKLDLLHYDLTTATLVGDTSLDHHTGSANGVSVVVQPDGGWRVIASSSSYHGFQLVSGHDLKSTYDGRLAIPFMPQFSSGGFTGSTGVVGATTNELWFKPRSIDLPGIRAIRMPTGAAASTIVDATALPCAESDGVLKLKLTCSPPPASPLSIRVRTKDGTATASNDFTAVDRMETLAAGQTEAIVSIPITQDTELEPTEFFEVDFSDASPSAVLPVTRVTATIRATSLDLLAPTAVYQPGPDAVPHRVYLASGTLLQFNQMLQFNPLPETSALKLARKPFDGDEWSPSPNWGRAPVPGHSAELQGRNGNLALLREENPSLQLSEYTLYDVPNDQVLLRVGSSVTYSPRTAAVGPSRFYFRADYPNASRECDLVAPHALRSITRPPFSTWRAAAYTRDFLAILNGSGGIEKYSLADGSYLGTLLPSGPWTNGRTMVAEDDLLAIRDNDVLWVLSIDHPEQVKEVKLPPGGAAAYLEFAEGLLYSGTPAWPTVHVIDPRNGVLLETLSQEFTAAVPEGWAGSGVYPTFNMRSLSVEGTKAAMLAFEEYNYNDAYHDIYRVVRLSREGKLPSLRNPEPFREGDGSLSLQLAEAAPFPITVTTRTVTTVQNQQEDWSGTGSAVIPAGQATFATGLSVVDDHLSEGLRYVALEVTLTGNGHTEKRRLPLLLQDNDRVFLTDVPRAEVYFDWVFAAAGGAWAHRSGIEGFSWTGDPDFFAATPYGWEANYEFPTNMAGSGDWLAVTHDTWGGNFDIKNPSSVFLYKPASGSQPVRILKGMKRDNYFGYGLFARSNKLWVGAPGRYETNGKKKIDVKGQAFEYDMATGKRTRTYKPQKQYARGFGRRITANDSSVWFSSYDSPTKTGAVSQYSLATGKWVRTLPDPFPGVEAVFGGQLEANADTLIATTQGQVRGYSTATGALSWTIAQNGTAPFNAIELVRDDLLAVASDSLYFYHLVPGQDPVMLVDVTSYNFAASKMEANGHELLLFRDGGSSQGASTIIDLRGIPHLAAFFPSAITAAAAPRSAITAHAEAGLPPDGPRLAKGPDGWTLSFGSGVPLAGVRGSEVILESSTDLAQWESVARYLDGVGWQPLVDWLSAGEGNAVNIGRNDPARYFRLRLSPVAE